MIRMMIFLLFLVFAPFIIHAVDLMYTTHPDQQATDLELRNLTKEVQPKITMADRNPVDTDAKEEGSLWFNGTSNKIFIREKTSWTQLN